MLADHQQGREVDRVRRSALTAARRTRRACALLTGLVVLAGCGTGAGSIPVDEPEVQLLDMAAPVTEPAWGTEHNMLFGFVEAGGRQLARIDPETGATLATRGAERAGGNVAVIGQPSERLALPLPGPGQIMLLDSETLEEVDRLDAGTEPSWVAVHPTSKSVFALCAEGRTVTGVHTETEEIESRTEVEAGPEAVVAPGSDTTAPAFWVITPEGFTHYVGQPPQRRMDRSAPVDRHTVSPDDDSERSAYFAENGSPRVLLVEGSRRVAASPDLGAPVEHLEAHAEQELRVYAVTADRLHELVFDTLEVERSTDFRDALTAAGLRGPRSPASPSATTTCI